jgi:uncharacterized protein with HEPN domain
MAVRTMAARLFDIVNAIERVRGEAAGIPLDTFKVDWRRLWLVERGLEIVSEASRHLGDDLKGRHPEIPWRRIAGVGNVLRHEYDRVAADVMWHVVQDDLDLLDQVCRQELSIAQACEQGDQEP